MPPDASAPLLLEPADGQPAGGAVTFRWLPQGVLRPGTAYEVVWWNATEQPAVARGLAAPTVSTSLSANLDVLYHADQIKSAAIWWTVLVVRVDPYLRLTAPQQAAARQLVYRAPPPKPRE